MLLLPQCSGEPRNTYQVIRRALSLTNIITNITWKFSCIFLRRALHRDGCKFITSLYCLLLNLLGTVQVSFSESARSM